MGPIQSSINQLNLAALGATAAVSKSLTKGLKSAGDAKQSTDGIDIKMAAKARKTAQQKINAIYANKELSSKARTRRMGQVIDEYNKELGGKK